MKTKLAMFLTVLAIGAGLAFWQVGFTSPAVAGDALVAAKAATLIAAGGDEAEYVGNKKCKMCHKKEFESWDRLQFHLAPPITAKKDPETGHLQKSVYGPSTMRLFRLLARMRRFRGTWLDVFGRTEERQMERRLVAEYRKLIDEVASTLDATNHAAAIALMAYPSRIRGYGHVKLRNAGLAEAEKQSLLDAFKSGVRIEEAAE